MYAGGALSKQVEESETGAGLGWVLVMEVKVEGRSGTAAREGVILFMSTGLDVSSGLESAENIVLEVVVDVGAVVILEGKTGAGEEGLVVTVQARDSAAGALDSAATEPRKGL